MSTPIEALAQEYAEVFIQELYDLPKSALPKLEIEVKSVAAAYIAGAKAASGRVAELEAALEFKKESKAFEELAKHVGCDMRQHPLHYLFLDGKTAHARDIWNIALKYARQALSGAGKGEG